MRIQIIGTGGFRRKGKLRVPTIVRIIIEHQLYAVCVHHLDKRVLERIAA